MLLIMFNISSLFEKKDVSVDKCSRLKYVYIYCIFVRSRMFFFLQVRFLASVVKA